VAHQLVRCADRPQYAQTVRKLVVPMTRRVDWLLSDLASRCIASNKFY
jgi:hypothetical protein